MQTMHVYTARKIHTMDESLPLASAVGVIGDRIVAVGELADMEPWYAGRNVVVDDRYRDQVLMPGLIDNHIHPYLGAILTPMQIIAPEPWRRDDGSIWPAARTATQYRELLAGRLAALTDTNDWFISFGYQPALHGRLFRQELDALCPDRPVILWQRSFHETYINSKGIEKLGISQAEVDAHPQADWETGHFYETGNKMVMAKLMPYLLRPQWYNQGLAVTASLMHQGGITTAGDMLFGAFNPRFEQEAIEEVIVRGERPVRVVKIFDVRSYSNRASRRPMGPPDAPIDFGAGLSAIDSAVGESSSQIWSSRAVKLFADGAMFSQLMQMRSPGYIDGHHGEWLMSPERLIEALQVFWPAGYQIHVHVNGDAGMDAVIAALEMAQRQWPRFDHRFHVHHVGQCSVAQIQRLAALGASASVNPYYIHALADDYSLLGLGPERASQITRCGSMLRAGMRVSFHSDFMMAPTEPLLLAWCAANRLTASGKTVSPTERLSLEQALRGVTIDAAWALGLDHEIGSITCGKKADFVVLQDDPWALGVERLKDVRIAGTVFEGRHFPLAQPVASLHASVDGESGTSAIVSNRAARHSSSRRSPSRYRAVRGAGIGTDSCCGPGADRCDIVRLWASWMGEATPLSANFSQSAFFAEPARNGGV